MKRASPGAAPPQPAPAPGPPPAGDQPIDLQALTERVYRLLLDDVRLDRARRATQDS